MGEVVNLNRFRKSRAKDDAKQADRDRAARNRTRHGLGKGEKLQSAIDRARAARDLDGKKLT